METDVTTLETLLSLSLGLGLAAACGFRIFVPLLMMSIASLSGYLELMDSFAWIGTWPALTVLAIATLLEIGAYYLPWLDNFLDTLGAPAAVVAGTIVTASAVLGMDPMLKWSLAVIAGGGAAGAVHTGLAAVRGLSSASTGGLANPLISTAEAGGSISFAILSLLLPFAGLALFVALVTLALAALRRWRARQRQQPPVQPTAVAT
jgi:hypothetical protein